MKRWLIVAAPVVLLLLAWLAWGPPVPEASPPPAEAAPPVPSFQVKLNMPWLARAFGGILPNWIEDRIEGATPRELRFGSTSAGAEIAGAGPLGLALRAEGGWDLRIVAEADGRIAAGTRLIFPIYLGERHVVLNCWPAETPVGSFRGEPAADGRLGGSFLIELADCKNEISGKDTDWPPAPLKLRGRFAGLSPGAPETMLPPL